MHPSKQHWQPQRVSACEAAMAGGLAPGHFKILFGGLFYGRDMGNGGSGECEKCAAIN